MSDEILTINIEQNDNTDEFLAHFGIKGMKWGVRHQPGPDGRVGKSGTPIATDRAGKADAKAWAQAYNRTGTGSVKARKALKQTIDENSKNANYKKAFDYHKERENNKYVVKQVAKAVAPTVAIGAAYAAFMLNGASFKLNGPLAEMAVSHGKSIASGAKFVAKLGPTMVNNYRFAKIVKNF